VLLLGGQVRIRPRRSRGPSEQGARIAAPLRATDEGGSALILSPPDRVMTFETEHYPIARV
jgi:hypothetical protein